jgi:hypothetical protein
MEFNLITNAIVRASKRCKKTVIFFNNSLFNLKELTKGEGDDPTLTEPDRKNRFSLKIELLPCHISVAVAEKIFFIGESIQLFERERRLESHGAVLKDKEAEFYSQLVRFDPFKNE